MATAAFAQEGLERSKTQEGRGRREALGPDWSASLEAPDYLMIMTVRATAPGPPGRAATDGAA